MNFNCVDCGNEIDANPEEILKCRECGKPMCEDCFYSKDGICFMEQGG